MERCGSASFFRAGRADLRWLGGPEDGSAGFGRTASFEVGGWSGGIQLFLGSVGRREVRRQRGEKGEMDGGGRGRSEGAT